MRQVLEQPCASGADHPHVDSMALVLRNVDDADAHISAGEFSHQYFWDD